MFEVTCKSRKVAETNLVNVARTLRKTVSLSGIRGVCSERPGLEEGLVVVLFSNTALSESREVTLIRGRIERIFRGKDRKV